MQIELEKRFLGPLPAKRIDSFKELTTVVSGSSTILVNHNTYSLDSRSIGETVTVKVFAEYLEVRFAQKRAERIPRLRGEGKHRIQYRQIIDSLVRKPGAFENYKYKQDLFPTTRFRMVYDGLMKTRTARGAAKEYLSILNLAAKESESLVDEAIRILLYTGTRIIDSQAVKEAFEALKTDNRPREVAVHVATADPGHTICAIAHELVLRGHRVLFKNCEILVQELLIAKRDSELPAALNRLSAYTALIIDDIGYVQQNRDEMEVLFTLLADRYERASTMITSNLPFSKWEKIFKDPMTTAAAIDRLVHHSMILELNLTSYRLEHAQKEKN